MPISDCEVRDPRIRRTRQLLQGALHTLMQTKGFDEISVQDITDPPPSIAPPSTTTTPTNTPSSKPWSLAASTSCSTSASNLRRHLSLRGQRHHPRRLRLPHPDPCNSTECTRQSAFEPLVEAAITTAIRRVIMNGMPKEASPPGSRPR